MIHRTRPFLAACLTIFAAFATANTSFSEQPKLVLLVVVDQLRGDMPLRFKDRFGPGGFRYFMDEGTVFTQANFTHSTTFTAVGHATIATGGNSAQHGVAGNDWYDTQSRKRVYCVEDSEHAIIGEQPADHEGTSPKNLTSSTFGDELSLATAGASRVFSVSVKDRGAILPAGHLGKAFWYGKNTGRFVTSTYYYAAYPPWVAAWNDRQLADQYGGRNWDLLHDISTYVYGDKDDRPHERSYKHLGNTFPHPLLDPGHKDFYSALRLTPMADELTLEFAIELLKQERVGQRGVTDVLCVSLSSTDYIGHAFGPNSLEAEDNLLRVDVTVEKLLRAVDERVGLERTLAVLTSDHGTDAIPESLQEVRLCAGRHHPDHMLSRLNAVSRERFHTEEDLVAAFWNPSLYLNTEAVQTSGLDVEDVERALAEEVRAMDGFAWAVTRTDLLRGGLKSGPILDKVQRAFHPKRSGNVLVVQDIGWYLYPDAEIFSAMHGSPYSYDTYVPIMVAGPGIRHQCVTRPVAPRDIASTITMLLGIKPPSGSTGIPLAEVLPKAAN